jgi:hypothetical protein
MAILRQSWDIVKQGPGLGATPFSAVGASQIAIDDKQRYFMEGGEGKNNSQNKEVNLSFMHGNRRPTGKKINPPPNTQQERWERVRSQLPGRSGLILI